MGEAEALGDRDRALVLRVDQRDDARPDLARARSRGRRRSPRSRSRGPTRPGERPTDLDFAVRAGVAQRRRHPRAVVPHEHPGAADDAAVLLALGARIRSRRGCRSRSHGRRLTCSRERGLSQRSTPAARTSPSTRRGRTPRARAGSGARFRVARPRVSWPREPPRAGDEPVPAPARGQSGRLVRVGRRGVRAGARRGQADPALDRLRRVPLVPRHGARVVRGPGTSRR